MSGSTAVSLCSDAKSLSASSILVAERFQMSC